jgi:nifR3 family TIM-barrel protein
MTWHIGAVPIHGRVVLAPMAGTTDSPFRRVCKRFGAALVFTELVSAEGLIRSRKRTSAYLEFTPEERPIAFQFFSASPESMGRAVADAMEWGPDIVDVNLGCPARKVVRKGAGASLLRDVPRLKEVVAAAVEGSRVPVTVKLRSGWDEGTINALATARAAVSAGAAAVTLHPRTRAMGFKGSADWELISLLVQRIPVPVIGSGDVTAAQDAVGMAQRTGCAAVMIGRAVRGNPWLLRASHHALEGLAPTPAARPSEVCRVAREHLELHRNAYGDRRLKDMAAQLCWYLRGFPNASRLRARAFAAASYAELDTVLTESVAGADGRPPG